MVIFQSDKNVGKPCEDCILSLPICIMYAQDICLLLSVFLSQCSSADCLDLYCCVEHVWNFTEVKSSTTSALIVSILNIR